MAVIPAAILVSREVQRVSLLDAGAAVPLAALLGLAAIAAARRARERVQLTIGRVGEDGVARLGRALGLLGVCLAFTAAVALAFFGVLKLLS